jgi:putative ABC transport system ATP-binding protein
MSRPPAVHLKGVRFAYRTGPLVLDIQELLVPAGETVFLHGPSGSGKTTLLGLIAGVLGASQGEVRVLGTDLGAIRGAQRDAFRGSHMGYIFQMFNLIPYLTALENITLPCHMSGARRARVDGNLDDAARALADRLEITGHLRQRPGELSVGQQQRVAACRALLGSPELVVADEPTSALDHDRRTRFLELLFDSCDSVGATLLFVSHDRTLEGLFDRALSLPEVNRVGLSAA